MIHEMKPYPAYKDSGVPWLGEIPAHWEAPRLRNIVHLLVSNVDKHTIEGEIPVRLCNYVDVYRHDVITDRLSYMRATATGEEIKRFRLRVGDVVITKDSEAWDDIGVPALLDYEAPDFVCGYHLAILRPDNHSISGRSLLRCLQSRNVAAQFSVAANGITRYGLSHQAIKNVRVPVAPLPEQAAIVRFLDYVDRRTRRYIRAKRKLIALLEEQKQAIIQRAVTRGLDPNVRLKSSGVEWLGDIPEHWEIVPLKSLASIQSGITLGKDYLNREVIEYPYLRVANVQAGHLVLSEVKMVFVPPKEAERSMLRKGDVLMTEGGDPDKLGRGCLWEGQIAPCLHQNHIFAVRTRPDQLQPDFLAGLLSSQYAKIYFLRSAKQTTNLASTNRTTVGRLPVLLPSLEEQAEVLAHLQVETDRLDQSMANTRSEIDLIREYRARLIADVVTGKLDVRQAAPNLPEEAEEPEDWDADEAEEDNDEGMDEAGVEVDDGE